MRHWRHGHRNCSAAPSGQAPTPLLRRAAGAGLDGESADRVTIMPPRCPPSSDTVREIEYQILHLRRSMYGTLTGLFGPPDPRCFIPQADEGARATAPTGPDHFPAPSFPTTDRWCDKHRSVPAFVRLLTAASVTLSRDIRHTPISPVFLLRGVICYRFSCGYPLT